VLSVRAPIRTPQASKPFAIKDGMLDPFARIQQLSKPLIVVVHGDTWNMGHELHLVADIRVAGADVRFGQDENTHGRFPGGGSTIRFPREAGWGNAMRYMLTGGYLPSGRTLTACAIIRRDLYQQLHDHELQLPYPCTD
jgi:enoyl-CoA hydratase/carnithine racemase